MKIEITLKSGVQFVTDSDGASLKGVLTSIGEHMQMSIDKGKLCVEIFNGDLAVFPSEIAAIRRIEETTQTFEPVDNDPEQVYERELEKERGALGEMKNIKIILMLPLIFVAMVAGLITGVVKEVRK